MASGHDALSRRQQRGDVDPAGVTLRPGVVADVDERPSGRNPGSVRWAATVTWASAAPTCRCASRWAPSKGCARARRPSSPRPPGLPDEHRDQQRPPEVAADAATRDNHA